MYNEYGSFIFLSLATVLHTVKINKYARFDLNVPYGSRVMSIFTN